MIDMIVKHRKMTVLILMLVSIGVYATMAYAQSNDTTSTTTTTGTTPAAKTQPAELAPCAPPQTKGEGVQYAVCLKAHDDALRQIFYNKLYGDPQFEGDIKLEQQVRDLVKGCRECVVDLPPAKPVPTLVPLTIPKFGNADEALSIEDRNILASMEAQHDQNQKTAGAYIQYFESRISYYAHPKIECPPTPEIPFEVCYDCVTYYEPETSTEPGPNSSPEYKRDNVHTNPATEASSSDPAIVDLPESPAPEPPAAPTPPGAEPS